MTENQAVAIALKVLRECPAQLAAEIIGISAGTLRSWRDSGKIASSRDRRTGRYRHDVLGVLLRDDAQNMEGNDHVGLAVMDAPEGMYWHEDKRTGELTLRPKKRHAGKEA